MSKESINKRLETAIRIVNKYEKEKLYAFKPEVVDIFELFSVDQNQPSEVIQKQLLDFYRIFHPDMVKQIPEEYRFTYNKIATKIVPTLNLRVASSRRDGLEERKRKIEKFAKELEQKSEEEREQFFKEAEYEFRQEKIAYDSGELHKEQGPQKEEKKTENKTMSIEEIMMHVMNCASRYYNETSQVENYFSIFGINQKEPNSVILNSPLYASLKQVYATDSSKIVSAYQDIFKKLSDMFIKFDSEILHSEEARKSYEKTLNQDKKQEQQAPYEAQSVLENCMRRLRMDKGSVENYFFIFDINHKNTNSEIIASERYKKLKEIFETEPVQFSEKYQDMHFQLRYLFKQFDERILHNETNRRLYEEKLGYSTKKKEDTLSKDEIIAEVMGCASRYYEDKTPIPNCFVIFSINRNNSNTEILKSIRYKRLQEVFKTDVNQIPEYYREIYQKLIDLFNKFNNRVLRSEESRKRYEQKLEQSTKKKEDTLSKDAIIAEVIGCSKRYYDDKGPIEDYFTVFAVDNKASSSTIIQSERYKKLKEVFKTDSKDIPEVYREVYQKLVSWFQKFDLNILNNEPARRSYEQALENQKQTQQKKEQPKEDPLGAYASMIRGLVFEYKTKYKAKSFIDYYELLKIDGNKSASALKQDATLQYMKSALDKNLASKFETEEDRQAFLELCGVVENFIDWTLQSEANKRAYDEERKRAKNPKKEQEHREYQQQNSGQQRQTESEGQSYYYTFQSQEMKNSFRFRVLRTEFYKILQNLVQEYGATKTVIDFTTYLKMGNLTAFPEDVRDMVDDIPYKEYIKFLKSEFGPEENTWIPQAINCLLTDKIYILFENSYPTYEKYGEEQLAAALEQYAEKQDNSYFSRGVDGISGRTTILKEIDPDLIQRIIGATVEEYSVLMDGPHKKVSSRIYKELARRIAREYEMEQDRSFKR